MSSIVEQLKAIAEETRQFKQLIDEEQWDLLNQKAESRQKQLELIFKSEIDTDIANEVREHVQAILELDKAYAEQVKASKEKEVSNVVDIRSRFSAAKKYKNIHDDT